MFAVNNTERRRISSRYKMPVLRSQDIGEGWQHGEALVTFKYHGLLGNRLKYLICRRCGVVLYQCVAEPHRFPQARR